MGEGRAAEACCFCLPRSQHGSRLVRSSGSSSGTRITSQHYQQVYSKVAFQKLRLWYSCIAPVLPLLSRVLQAFLSVRALWQWQGRLARALSRLRVHGSALQSVVGTLGIHPHLNDVLNIGN